VSSPSLRLFFDFLDFSLLDLFRFNPADGVGVRAVGAAIVLAASEIGVAGALKGI
jgi:hypothetical protein